MGAAIPNAFHLRAVEPDDATPRGLNANFDFGVALRALKNGKRVARRGWNGKGMWLVLMRPGGALSRCAIPAEGLPPLDLSPCIAMKTAGGDLQPGWLASQADMLADDWEVVA